MIYLDLEDLLHIAERVLGDVEVRDLGLLEAAYPVLRGTIRDPGSARRRPFIRFFACEQDLSHDPPEADLPEPVCRGLEPFLIVGAMAGG